MQFRSVGILAAAMLAAATPASAEDCKPIQTQAEKISTAEGAFLVLLQSRERQAKSYLIQEDCVTIDRHFWPRSRQGRFLYLAIVNYVPGDEEPEPAYIGIQASRPNPRKDGTDLVRVYRNGTWIREHDGGKESVRRVPGRVTDLNVKSWIELHRDATVDLTNADKLMKAKWHAQPAEDLPSSWELKSEWTDPVAYPDGTLLTNLLLRFTTNRDPDRVSLIPFEIGIPDGTTKIVVTVHSNIESINQKVEFHFP